MKPRKKTDHKTYCSFKPIWFVRFEVQVLSFCVAQIKVTQSTQDHEEPQIINTLGKGDYFGEKALIRCCPFSIPSSILISPL